MRSLPIAIFALLAVPQAFAQPKHPANERAQQEAQVYLRPCGSGDAEARQWCEMNRTAFLADYQKAKAGDYQGQRNVAFMLSGAMRNPAENPTTPDALQACAWRMVIMLQGHSQMAAGDTSNMRVDCTRPGVSTAPAEARAQQLLREIRTDPARMPPAAPRRAPPPGPLDGTASPLRP